MRAGHHTTNIESELDLGWILAGFPQSKLLKVLALVLFELATNQIEIISIFWQLQMYNRMLSKKLNRIFDARTQCEVT